MGLAGLCTQPVVSPPFAAVRVSRIASYFVRFAPEYRNVALTRRAGAEFAGLVTTPEPTLVRHLHDLDALREHHDPAEVAALAREIMRADAAAYGNQFSAYRETHAGDAAGRRGPCSRCRLRPAVRGISAVVVLRGAAGIRDGNRHGRYSCGALLRKLHSQHAPRLGLLVIDRLGGEVAPGCLIK